MMWRVSHQHYGRHQLGAKPPTVTTEQYETRELADARKRELQAQNYVACVDQLPPPRSVRKRADQHWEPDVAAALGIRTEPAAE